MPRPLNQYVRRPNPWRPFARTFFWTAGTVLIALWAALAVAVVHFNLLAPMRKPDEFLLRALMLSFNVATIVAGCSIVGARLAGPDQVVPLHISCLSGLAFLLLSALALTIVLPINLLRVSQATIVLGLLGVGAWTMLVSGLIGYFVARAYRHRGSTPG
jgi:hypothetical protein